MKAIQINLEEKTTEQLSAYCQKAGENKDEFVSHLLTNYLDRNDSDAMWSRLQRTSFDALGFVVDE